MDHRQFEDWLLDDERLAPEKDRILRDHLRGCQACSTLERANLILRSQPVLAPAAGFSTRFQVRLLVQRRIERKQAILGLLILALLGIVGLLLLMIPLIPYLSLSPAQLADFWVNNLIYIGLSIRVLSALGITLFNVLVSNIPTYVWAGTILFLCGIAPLWAFSYHTAGKMLHSVVNV